MSADVSQAEAEADSSVHAGSSVQAAGLAAFFTGGRLTTVPRKPARREQLLRHLARTLFEADRRYSEREVNEALLTVHDDFPALRRYLVEAKLLTRDKDGSGYQRAAIG
ncbi:DUF2087 domain-containing protein [Kitasatospora sp. RB6PN24]|uniref:DUF2087 domain-containing protein n=1 Tax=Kitasatospora humi TaxID=2893891 RepID=UPI001E63A9BA|nr:DUF2087 domain-containing protein [Kitasatospora humi]MCC9311167.1 DUF2087 domain-containing protein [Kitasatospora humi]